MFGAQLLRIISAVQMVDYFNYPLLELNYKKLPEIPLSFLNLSLVDLHDPTNTVPCITNKCTFCHLCACCHSAMYKALISSKALEIHRHIIKG